MRNIISGSGYEIVTVDPLKSEEVADLLGQGFRFHDRVLNYEIDLKSYAGQETAAGVNNMDISFEYSDDYEPAMYDLASQVFTTDRRFHFETVFDSVAAREVIDQYIDSYKAEGCRIFKAKHGDQLLGFAILDEHMDPKGISFENVLGATTPGIKGKMVATSLYSLMLKGQSDTFRKYIGRVSSSNAASINLHNQLGGRVVSIYDEYIKKNNL